MFKRLEKSHVLCLSQYVTLNGSWKHIYLFLSAPNLFPYFGFCITPVTVGWSWIVCHSKFVWWWWWRWHRQRWWWCVTEWTTAVALWDFARSFLATRAQTPCRNSALTWCSPTDWPTSFSRTQNSSQHSWCVLDLLTVVGQILMWSYAHDEPHCMYVCKKICLWFQKKQMSLYASA